MNTPPRTRVLITSFTLAFASGCGGADPLGRLALGGDVTLDNTPLAQGTIQFVPDDPAKTRTGGVVQQGRFDLAAKNGLVPGKYRVMIFSPNDEREQVAMEGAPGPGIMVSPELIPDRYNQNTELEVEVSADGENSFTFDLTSEVTP